jgi:hypothetical protein
MKNKWKTNINERKIPQENKVKVISLLGIWGGTIGQATTGHGGSTVRRTPQQGQSRADA